MNVGTLFRDLETSSDFRVRADFQFAGNQREQSKNYPFSKGLEKKGPASGEFLSGLLSVLSLPFIPFGCAYRLPDRRLA